MIETLVKKTEQLKEENKIPSYLIKEEIDGIPYFYKGYKSVLTKEKTIEDIIGTSGLQALLVEVLMKFLFVNIGRDKYRFFTNEVGGHIKKGTNLSFDIAIFNKEVLTIDKIDEHYVNVPPEAVIEIDVKIEIENQIAMDYITAKTDKLLEYGCQKVLWVLTKSKKVIIATPPSDEWQIINWSKDIPFLENTVLNIGDLLEAEGMK
jgi:Uma2 family endonuclease